jgi:hypothetical protein
MGFVVDKVALKQVSSASVSPANAYSANCFIFINHPMIDAK